MLSSTIIRDKNRCSTREIKSNKLYSDKRGELLWTMFRDMWGKSYINANSSISSASPRILCLCDRKLNLKLPPPPSPLASGQGGGGDP